MTTGDVATLVVVFGFGLVALAGVWWTARLRDRADAEALRSAPERVIPGFAGEPDPRYVAAADIARESAHVRPLSGDERGSLGAALASAPSARAGALPGFVTDPASGWAVLDRAAIAWCVDGLGSEREVMNLVRALRAAPGPERSLVCLAPWFADSALDCLRANVAHGTLRALAVEAAAEAAQTLAPSTGARPLRRTALVADYVTADDFGAADRWVSDAERSWVIAA